MSGGGSGTRRRARTPVVLALSLVAALFYGGAAMAEARPRLEVVDQDSGRVVYSRTVVDGERFTMTHTHSVTRREVVEIFSAGTGGIHMEELRFDEFGPNLPAGPERIDGVLTTFRHVGGEFRVDHHSRVLGTIPLLTGSRQVDHTLIFADGRQVRLIDVVGAHEPVELRIHGAFPPEHEERR